MVTVWFGVGQFLSGAMGQLYPGGDIPRKHLGYRTPTELFDEFLDQVYSIAKVQVT